MDLELGIAWRYLRGRQRSRVLSFLSLIAVGGVIVGVSALIVVMGIMNGLQRDMREKILLGTPDIRVTSAESNPHVDNWEALLPVIRRTPGVVAAAPYATTQALATAGADRTEMSIVMGLPKPDASSPAPTDIRQHAIRGDFTLIGKDSLPAVVVGKLLAERLSVDLDSVITLYGPGERKMSQIGQVIPVVMRFVVGGIFETGLYDYDNSFVYVPLANAQELAGVGAGVSGIEVRTRDRQEATQIASRLTPSISPYVTIDWQEQNHSLFAALQLEKLGMGVILLLIVIVAAFNIVSNLTMVVADKTTEIGILKAMGMTSKSVRRVFFAQGLVIGAVGTALGVILGIAVSLALGKYEIIKLDPSVYFIDHVPVATDVVDVILTVIASLAIAALATVYPSRQAAKLYPIDAIRYD
jgi:lipoprotein-releasing system permease protein